MSNSTKEIASKSNERFKYLKKDTWNCLSWTCNHLVELLIPILGPSHEYVMLRDITSDSVKNNLENWDKDQEKLNL